MRPMKEHALAKILHSSLRNEHTRLKEETFLQNFCDQNKASNDQKTCFITTNNVHWDTKTVQIGRDNVYLVQETNKDPAHWLRSYKPRPLHNGSP